ncbi:hypothetical protein DYT72_17970 [Escherichia coli]|nr:hypothetical protein [Escherichia coli]
MAYERGGDFLEDARKILNREAIGPRQSRFSIGSAPLTSITKSDAQISGGETRQDLKIPGVSPWWLPRALSCSCLSVYWPGEYADRNRAVANQRLTGSNARWKWTTDYNRRSIAETAMYRVKQLFGGSLTLRDYDGQVAEAMALVRALNKMTKAGMPESVRIA